MFTCFLVLQVVPPQPAVEAVLLILAELTAMAIFPVQQNVYETLK